MSDLESATFTVYPCTNRGKVVEAIEKKDYTIVVTRRADGWKNGY